MLLPPLPPSLPPPYPPQHLRLLPHSTSTSLSLPIHSRYLQPLFPNSSSPSLHRSPAITSISIFPALFPGCGFSDEDKQLTRARSALARLKQQV